MLKRPNGASCPLSPGQHSAIWFMARPIGVVLSIALLVGIEGAGSIQFRQDIGEVQNAASKPVD